MKQIAISDKTWDLLKRCAEPYVDKAPDDTVSRVLQAYFELREGETVTQTAATQVAQTRVHPAAPSHLDRRAPRERGVRIMLDGERIIAVSVRDLYEQALKSLVKKYRSRLEDVLPFATSSDRCLLAKKPKHPSGRSFVIPVEYDGFFMEAHKDYKNAIAHLAQLAKRLGISFDYLGR